MARAGQLTPRDYLLALMESCSRAGHEKRWVEKTPIHASYLEPIFELFPDARIVCMERKAKDVLTSAVATFGIPACIAALDYHRTYRDVRHFLNRHPSRTEQFFFVSYDKILDSDEPLEELLNFLNIENPPSTASVRLAAKGEFLALYGRSVMGTIQPGMGGASPVKSLNRRQSMAVDGLAAMLESRRLDQGMVFPESSNLQAVAIDMLHGMAYIARWRMHWMAGMLPSLFTGR